MRPHSTCQGREAQQRRRSQQSSCAVTRDHPRCGQLPVDLEGLRELILVLLALCVGIVPVPEQRQMHSISAASPAPAAPGLVCSKILFIVFSSSPSVVFPEVEPSPPMSFPIIF